MSKVFNDTYDRLERQREILKEKAKNVDIKVSVIKAAIDTMKNKEKNQNTGNESDYIDPTLGVPISKSYIKETNSGFIDPIIGVPIEENEHNESFYEKAIAQRLALITSLNKEKEIIENSIKVLSNKVIFNEKEVEHSDELVCNTPLEYYFNKTGINSLEMRVIFNDGYSYPIAKYSHRYSPLEYCAYEKDGHNIEIINKLNSFQIRRLNAIRRENKKDRNSLDHFIINMISKQQKENAKQKIKK